MTIHPPKVSIIIPTYNRRKMVCRAIDSVLAQSYANIQCVVVDDCSEDDTLPYLQQHYGNSILLLHNHQNREKSFSKNRGITAAEGTYIGFLDSDDTLPIDSVSTRMALFQEDPFFDGVSFGLRTEIHRGRIRHADSQKQKALRGMPLDLAMYLSDKSWLSTSSFLIPKAQIIRCGLFREELINREDLELFIRLLCHLPFRYCGQVVTHIHADAPNRTRSNYAKIIQQDFAFYEVLKENSEIRDKLGLQQLQTIRRNEANEILGALYHDQQYAPFRRLLEKMRKEGVVMLTAKTRKRRLLSFLLQWMKPLLSHEPSRKISIKTS